MLLQFIKLKIFKLSLKTNKIQNSNKFYFVVFVK